MDTSKPRLDRRIVRSRNAILSAFERLLMDKPLADITVSAIAREANVDRKTFYVHFGTVDGLLDAIAADVVEMIVDSVEKTLSTMGSDPNERALGAAATFFKTINEAFGQTFLELFGGGKATLELEDPENILECGVQPLCLQALSNFGKVIHIFDSSFRKNHRRRWGARL